MTSHYLLLFATGSLRKRARMKPLVNHGGGEIMLPPGAGKDV